MRKLERILWIVVGIAVVLKLLHLPLASVLLILSLSLLQMLYFALGWVVLPSPTRKDQHIGLTILTSVALSTLCCAVVFKVQAWPLSDVFSLMGFVLGCSAALWAILHARLRSDRRTYAKNILVRVLPLVAIVGILLPVSDREMILFHHRDATPEMRDLYDRLHATEDDVERDAIWHRIDSLEHAAYLRQTGQHP